MRISATIITLNEESRIGRACESLRDVADEIIIVDSFSQDRTLEVAHQFTTHVFTHKFESYSRQKNWAVTQATYPWILSVDADECLSDELKESILKLKAQGSSEHIVAYRFARRANYLGAWIRHSGWYPDYKIRLYNPKFAQWEGDFVHEGLTINGKVETLQGDLLHYTVGSIADHLERLNRYTSLAARQSLASGGRFSLLECVFTPPLTFLRTLLLQGGILDGWRGFCIALFAGWYVFVKQAKLWELRSTDKRSADDKP